MGRAARWIRALLGMKKEKEKEKGERKFFKSKSGEFKDKKRWNFTKSGNDSGKIPAVDSSSWMRTYMTESEKEQSKHAIAVAAATAAAADAAVAAAHAAVAVVRLTSQGRGTLFNGGRQRWAALTIQTFFRGFLARKALRALKGVVKLQALFRGHLIRKRATATLHSMQALIRAQVAVRTDRARRSLTRENRRISNNDRNEFVSKRHFPVSSAESCINGLDESPKIVEIDTFKPETRSEASFDTFSSSPIGEPIYFRKPNRRNIDQTPECVFAGNECRFSTALSSPRTPAKSVCGDSFFRPYSNIPNYMADTKSFRAKLRSLSAPKQRPERKVVSLEEILASRNSISCIRMQRFS